MTYSYQPVIIKKLLESENRATKEDVAKVLLDNDYSLLDYYKKVVMRWPKNTLEKHKVIKYDKKSKVFTLLLDDITREQKETLVQICDKKYASHRNASEGARKKREPIPGPLQFEVLKKSHGICALCNHKKPLEIDHIQPISRGGSDDLSNLQALCRACNAQKNNRDNTDFTKVCKELEYREPDCLFCKPKNVIKSKKLALVVHTLDSSSNLVQVIPKRHVGTFDDLIQAEQHSCMELVKSIKTYFKVSDNISVNFNSIDKLGHFHIDVLPMI